MSNFIIETTPLDGLRLVTRRARNDSRGWFERLFCAEELAAAAGQPFHPVQINRSFTRVRGTVRGMHFQRPPHAEIKLVSCTGGEVYDVAVDLRAGSPTFLRWYGTRLSATNRRSLLIPCGFAHGFQTLTPDVELLYLHSTSYAPETEGGVHPLDPAVNIAWPRKLGEMSPRDAKFPFLQAGYAGIPTSP